MFNPPKKDTPPAPRRIDLESLLCKAVLTKQVTRIRYRDQSHSRTFEPYIVYQSSTGKFLVHGLQTKDGSDIAQRNDRHSFEIGRLNSVILIEETFKYEADFSSFKIDFGMYVICAVDRR